MIKTSPTRALIFRKIYKVYNEQTRMICSSFYIVYKEEIVDTYDMFYVVLAIAAIMYVISSIRCWIRSVKSDKERSRREIERKIRHEAEIEIKLRNLEKENRRNYCEWVE